jgi:hypothetical protein
VYTQSAVERLTREWIEVLHRDYSHPCIIAWVPLNESWGVPNLPQSGSQRSYVQALYHLTHALDGTRPVLSNDGWEHCVGDIIGIHDYTTRGSDLADRYGDENALEHTLRHVQPGAHLLLLPEAQRDAEPVILSEFGGISLAPAPDTTWFGYGTVQSTTEFLRKYAELVGAVAGSSALAGFCYTQLTDTLQETNGLVTERRVPKMDAALLQRITAGAALSELADETDQPRELTPVLDGGDGLVAKVGKEPRERQ